MTARQTARPHFRYRDDPPTVYYRGTPLALPRAQAKLLALLLDREFVTMADFLATGIATPGSCRAHLSNLRKQLPAGVKVASSYGQGYRLVVP